MPAESGPQYRFMVGIAHGMTPRSDKGPSKKVAQEFVDATPASDRSKWSRKNKKRTGFAGIKPRG